MKLSDLRLSNLNLSKLNHILIPSTPEEREKFRNSRSGAFFMRLFRLYFFFSQEGRVLLFCWMLASAMSINIGFTQYYVVWSGMTGLLLASLLLRLGVRLDGVSLELQGPRRVSVGDDVHFSVVFRNQSDRVHQAIRAERPFLSWDGKYRSPRMVVEHLEPGQEEIGTFVARFVARGDHHLDPVTARALTPLGLCLGREVSSLGLHFLVVPRIANVTHVAIAITEKYQPGGVALASITGESRELIGVRPYRPGDPIRDLHAKTWARVGEPVVREYRQEYFTRIGIVLDTNGGKSDEPVFEAMLSLAAGIVAQLSRGEALLDLLVIGDEIHQLTLGRSLGFLEQALDLLACVDPKGEVAIDALQSQLQPHLERLSCMVVVSLAWDEERERFAQWIEDQGVGCRRVTVASARHPSTSFPGAVTEVLAEDIQEQRELVI